MLKRLIGPLIFGLLGVGVLLALGFWQVSRLEWKLEIIANIEARIHTAPVPVPAQPDPVTDRYLPVTAHGTYTGEVVDVLSSQPVYGIGSHVIAVLETDDGRRLLVDRGFMTDTARVGAEFAGADAEVIGNLLWPADSDAYTPAPDLQRNLWFSRDVEPIAAYLGTEQVMIIAREDAPAVPGLAPTPINTAEIKNDHLGYAITWFSLAFVWALMTVILLWRIRRDRS